jgi:hypothetical protein
MALPDRSLLTVLLLLAGSLILLPGCGGTGCQGLPDDFERITPDDDDDDATDDDDVADDDDDDDDSTAEQPPTLTITTVDPPGEEVSDFVTVNFEIDDPDSTEFSVRVTYDDALAADNPATLDGSPNPWEGASASLPTEELLGQVVWDTVIDIPTVAEGVRIRLCPTDGEGNEGDCRTYPDDTEDPITVFNAPPPTSGELCQPGDLEELEFTSGEALIALSDGVCLNYEAPSFPIGTPTDFSAQFLVLLLNTGSSEATYEITSSDDPEDLNLGSDDDDAVGDDDDSGAGDDDDSANSSIEGLRNLRMAGVQQLANRSWAPSPRERVGPISRTADPPSSLGDDLPDIDLQASSCTEALTTDDLHGDIRDFKMRTELTQVPADRETVGATLRALGDNVAVYVDNSTPLDVDYTCDGNIDEPSAQPAEGFDNCDLQETVNVIEANIAPTMASLFGELSDVNSDCRVTVLVSHRLNALTVDTDLPYMVRSLVEPEIDLWAEDQSLNPNSNQEEIVYVYAPDPLRIYNPLVPVTLANYLNYELAGQIAYSWQKLISYNVHRQVGKTLLFNDNPDHVAKPPAEEDWLDDGMSWLAADMTGFGSIIHRDAWIYLDRPNLEGLRENNTIEDFEDRGAQYLFARYMVDLFGPSVIWDVLHAATMDPNTNELLPTQGVDSILTATLEDDFNEFALEWAAAMAVTSRLNDATPPTQLVLDTDVRQYDAPTSVVVPLPDVPVVGELYGANGFQQGIQLRGFNHTYLGGTNPAGPAELLYGPLPVGSAGQPLRKMENLDVQVFHPEREFYGAVTGLHGIAAVLVSGLTQPENFLLIESSSEDLLGLVIRLNNYHPIPADGDPNIPVTVEDSAATILTTSIPLGVLDPTGEERRVIGLIAPTVEVDLTASETPPAISDDDDAAPPEADDDDAGAEEETANLADTDRYTFELLSTQRVGMWIDRRYSDSSGGFTLDDPFIAVVPTSDVPDTSDYTMWNFGPTPSHGPCPDPALYQWPNTIPGWLNPQGDLIADPVVAEGYEPAVAGDGEQDPGFWECLYDHDQDGIPDEEEPAPATLLEQFQQRQAENILLDADFYAGGFGDAPWSLDVSKPWYNVTFVDVDSNEDPEDDLASAYLPYNIGGRAQAEGEEAVWQALLPAGEYTIVVGDGSEGVGPYDLSVRVLPN